MDEVVKVQYRAILMQNKKAIQPAKSVNCTNCIYCTKRIYKSTHIRILILTIFIDIYILLNNNAVCAVWPIRVLLRLFLVTFDLHKLHFLSCHQKS